MPKSKKNKRRKPKLLTQDKSRKKIEAPAVPSDQSLAATRAMLVKEPGKAKHYLDLSALEAAAGNVDNAAQVLRNGVDNCLQDANLPAQLAIMFARSGRADLAPDAFAVALAREDLPWIRRQAAFYQTQLGEFDQADRTLKLHLEGDADDVESLFVRALLRFAEGRYEEAWADYRYRWQVKGFFSPPKRTAKPAWSGEAVDRLLVWREQGIGDEIQFLRFLCSLSGKAQSVLYEGDPRLTGLLKRSFPDVDVQPIQNGDLLPNAVPDSAFDSQVPLGDVALALGGVGFGTAAPYLVANEEVTRKLGQQFKETFKGKKLIGLAWFSKNVEHGHGRSLDLKNLLPVISLPGYEFVSVQYGEVADLLKTFHQETGHAIRNFTGVDLYNQIDHSCSVLCALDGLITIDNTTAHLAGALGVPTALLLPKAADWRWHCPTSKGNGRIYKSHHLYRQSDQGQWGDPVAALEQSMDELFQRE